MRLLFLIYIILLSGCMSGDMVERSDYSYALKQNSMMKQELDYTKAKLASQERELHVLREVVLSQEKGHWVNWKKCPTIAGNTNN